MVIDLVCKMEVDENDAKPRLILEEKTYYFCSEGCRAEFERHARDYLKPVDAGCCNVPEEEADDNV